MKSLGHVKLKELLEKDYTEFTLDISLSKESRNYFLITLDFKDIYVDPLSFNGDMFNLDKSVSGYAWQLICTDYGSSLSNIISNKFRLADD